MVYRLSERATDDVFNVYVEGVNLFGPSQADTYYDGLTQTLEFLGQNPGAGRLRGEFDPPLRSYPYKAHIILYTMETFGVWIVRIQNAREDWTRQT